jgi:hypothetical protein
VKFRCHSIPLTIPNLLEYVIPKDPSILTDTEKLELLARDSPELLKLLDIFKEKIRDLQEKIIPVFDIVRNSQNPTEEGISFLEVKFRMLLFFFLIVSSSRILFFFKILFLDLLLNYCINICYYLLRKIEGKEVKDHPVIKQLLRQSIYNLLLLLLLLQVSLIMIVIS